MLQHCFRDNATGARATSAGAAVRLWYVVGMIQAHKYQRCMVMAGGGARFGIYLGMYAAACQAGRAPDILLASCGSAIAATIIRNLPDDAQRRAWLSSPQMYRFWSGLKSARHTGLVGTLLRAAQRKLNPGRAPTIPDLFGDYLFEMPRQLPFPPEPAVPAVDVGVIAGRLLFEPAEVGRPRGRRKLFAETVFCPPRAAALLHGLEAPLSDPRWGQHAVARALLTDSTAPLGEAARVSIADMIYFRCQRYAGHHYIGGVLDLFPIELARHLADEVMMEFKEAFDQTFAIPAWRAVLGLDGNQRLRYVNGQCAEVRIDTSDVSRVLAGEPVQKKLVWRHNRIQLDMPHSYDEFVATMEQQWLYGYERGMEAFGRPPGQPAAIRNATRHSKALR